MCVSKCTYVCVCISRCVYWQVLDDVQHYKKLDLDVVPSRFPVVMSFQTCSKDLGFYVILNFSDGCI